jgi:hypothetical protein
MNHISKVLLIAPLALLLTGCGASDEEKVQRAKESAAASKYKQETLTEMRKSRVQKFSEAIDTARTIDTPGGGKLTMIGKEDDMCLLYERKDSAELVCPAR